MKIAILTADFYKSLAEVHGVDRLVHGGGERYLVELVDLLISKGHKVTVFAGYRPPDGGSYPREVYKRYGNMKIVCMYHNEPLIFNCYPELNRWFNQRTVGYDLQIYFGPFLCWPHISSNAISVCHGIYWDYSHHQSRLWGDNDRDQFFKQNLYGFTAPRVCVSVDSSSKNVIASHLPGEQRNMVVIPNFVDPDRFTPGQRTWDGIRVLFPRRMHILRGQNFFNQAAKDLEKDPRYFFIACGQMIDGNEEAEMTKQIHRVHKNVLQTWVPMEDMPDLYQRSDIAVIPTLASEGTSISAAEAMSCGLPVIASNVGGLQQMVLDGYNGLVFDPDHDSLTDKIRILEDESLRKKMGARGREMALDSFNITTWRKKWLEVIEGVTK